MALKLKDGYTLPFVTEGEIRSTDGSLLYGNLSIIEGTYRPPLFKAKNDFEFALLRCRTGEEESSLIADFIAARVASWNVVFEGKDGKEVPAPITADFVRDHLPEQYTLAILKAVRKWDGETAAAGN